MLQGEPLIAFTDYANQLLRQYTGRLNSSSAPLQLHQLDMAIYKLENELSVRKADIIYDIRNDFEINHILLEEKLSEIAFGTIKELIQQNVASCKN